MCERKTSMAEECQRFTGLFEAELLTRLMLREWKHPLADDGTFVSELVEGAREILRQSVHGTELMEGVKPADMNFVAAVWYAEWSGVSAQPGTDPDGQRRAWLDAVRIALPSCFCDPRDLPSD